MISGLNSSTIDAKTVSSGGVNGAHKRPDAEEVFKKMDANGDGSVSEQEFVSAMVSISPQGANAADSADAQARAAAEFKKIDTNGDGSISESELAAGMKAHEAEHQGRTPAASGGGSGSGSPHGAPPAVGSGSQAQGASSSSSQTYDPADTNKDGKVSEQEALAYAAKQAAQHAATAAAKSYDAISNLSSGTQGSQAAE